VYDAISLGISGFINLSLTESIGSRKFSHRSGKKNLQNSVSQPVARGPLVSVKNDVLNHFTKCLRFAVI